MNNSFSFQGRIQFFTKKLFGYDSFQSAAMAKGFWDGEANIVPHSHIIETDGILWSIRIANQPEQG